MAGYSSHLPAMEEEEGAEPPLVARAAGSEALESLSHTSMRCGGCGAKVRVGLGLTLSLTLTLTLTITHALTLALTLTLT